MDDPNHGNNLPPFLPTTPVEVLEEGLRIMYTEQRIHNVKGDSWLSATNEQRFKDHYGANHFVAAQVFVDMQLLPLPISHLLHPKRLKLFYYLEALHFLKRYRKECEREARFDKSPKTLRKHCRYYLQRIQALKHEKIVFPEFGHDCVWVLSVDDIHCRINDPRHPEFSQDSHYYSHKWKHAGLCYELGIDLFTSKLIWMNGPFPAGMNDNKIFKEHGLKEKLAQIRRKALADKAYNGHQGECSTFNAYDCDAVKLIKSRAQLRHEQFNGMIHEFEILDSRFRHGEEGFKVCFEAVCVLGQYRMEMGEPLYNLLAGVQQVLDEGLTTLVE